MSRLAIIGTVEIQPGSREEVLQALLAHRERCLRDEPGTLQFEVLVPASEPNKLLLYELYTDRAAFSAHLKGASMATVRGELGAKIVGLSGVQCTPGGEFAA